MKLYVLQYGEAGTPPEVVRRKAKLEEKLAALRAAGFSDSEAKLPGELAFLRNGPREVAVWEVESC